MAAKTFDEWVDCTGWDGASYPFFKDCWDAATKAAEEKFTSTNTASFQLPISMESCVEHLRAMWGDIHITAEVRCAIEETHDYIERQLKTLL